MEKSFKQLLREYFSFMKKDRNGLMVMMILILLTIGGHFVVSRLDINKPVDSSQIILVFEAWQEEQNKPPFPQLFFRFNPNTITSERLDSLSIPDFVKRNLIAYRTSGGKFKQATDLRKIYGMNDSIFALIEPYLFFPEKAVLKPISGNDEIIQIKGFFDPNTAITEELLQFGFNRFQISNIEKYRQKGGIFYKPEDILKIYGIDSAFFNSISNQILIEDPYLNPIAELPLSVVRVELNAADSIDLVNLKGIGPVFASRILKYRSLLGGFYSTDQLLEVYGFPESTYLALKKNFAVDAARVEKLRINFAEYSDLIRHPYLKKEHVLAILNYRQMNGPFSTNEQVIRSGLIDSVSYMNIQPYLTCR